MDIDFTVNGISYYIIFSILLGLAAMALPVFAILSKKRSISIFVLISMLLCATSLLLHFWLMREYAVRRYIESFEDTIHATCLAATFLTSIVAALNLIAVAAARNHKKIQ